MARNKHDTSFLNLFDGKSLDGWKMAGISFKERMCFRQREEWGFSCITGENSKTLLWNLNGEHPV